jgi:hypothetical protein
MSTPGREEIHRLRNELVALQLVTVLVYHEAYAKAYVPSAAFGIESLCNAIAHVVTAQADLYRLLGDGAEIMRVDRTELAGGFFAQSGRCFCYIDGRAGLERLAMRTAEVKALTQSLRQRPIALDLKRA